MNKLNITLFTLFLLLLNNNINSMNEKKDQKTLFKYKNWIDQKTHDLGCAGLVFTAFSIGAFLYGKNNFKDFALMGKLGAGIVTGTLLFKAGKSINKYFNIHSETLKADQNYRKKCFGLLTILGTCASAYFLIKGIKHADDFFDSMTKYHLNLFSKTSGFAVAGLILGIIPNWNHTKLYDKDGKDTSIKV